MYSDPFFFISLRDGVIKRVCTRTDQQDDTRVPGTNSIRTTPDFAMLPHSGQLLFGDRPKITRENKRNETRLRVVTRHAIALFARL